MPTPSKTLVIQPELERSLVSSQDYVTFLYAQTDHQTDPLNGTYIRQPASCPNNIDALLPLLLRDLPSYSNRVSSRAQVLERSFNPRGVVIAAAQAPEDQQKAIATQRLFDGLPLTEDAIATHQLTPLFFTTLERQYVNDRAVRIQHYHWAFLSQTSDDEQSQWHLALLFSRIGHYPNDQPVSPPRESSQGSIGRGLQLWLRDCNADAIEALPRPTASDSELENE